MNTETVTVQPKGEGFEIIVQHDQTGSAYGIDLSKDAYEQLRLHFVGGSTDFQEDSHGKKWYWCPNCADYQALENEDGLKQCLDCPAVFS